MQDKITIIGADLTGLTLAYFLKKRNINVLILEANDRIGGRIQTINGANDTKIEMGATWFNDQHVNLKNLLLELDLNYFKQFTKGISLFETDANEPPQKFEIPSNQEESSYRIEGGTMNLINALASKLDKDQIHLNSAIVKISENNDEIEIVDEEGRHYKSHKIILTIPPNLLVNSVKFNPQFSSTAVDIFNKTHTWMGESIKFAVSYTHPFWKENGYSGTIFSHANIIQEQYDHSGYKNKTFALKGFLNSSSAKFTKEVREKMVISQLTNLLGEAAKDYLNYYEKLWQFEKFTFKPYQNYILPHQNNGNPIYKNSFMHGKLFLSGTETSPKFGGYMDGAISVASYINSII